MHSGLKEISLPFFPKITGHAAGFLELSVSRTPACRRPQKTRILLFGVSGSKNHTFDGAGDL